MRFRKDVSGEKREFLKEQLRQYKKEMPMTKEELHELEKWVASGRSPYDNGDYIYGEDGFPMDFVSAMRSWKEYAEWFDGLTAEEQMKERGGIRVEYSTEDDSIMIMPGQGEKDMDQNEGLPFN